MEHGHNLLFGYLLQPSVADLVVNDPEWAFHLQGELTRMPGDWLEYSFVSQQSFEGVTTTELLRGPPYVRSVMFLRRREFMLMVADARGVINLLLDRVLTAKSLRKFGVAVHTMVLDVMQKKLEIPEGTGFRVVPAIIYLQVATPGHAPVMESANFRGHDLSVSSMLVAQRERFVFRRCALRLPSQKTELFGINVDGAISFPTHSLEPGTDRAAGTLLEEVLLHLFRSNYFVTDVDRR